MMRTSPPPSARQAVIRPFVPSGMAAPAELAMDAMVTPKTSPIAATLFVTADMLAIALLTPVHTAVHVVATDRNGRSSRPTHALPAGEPAEQSVGDVLSDRPYGPSPAPGQESRVRAAVSARADRVTGPGTRPGPATVVGD